MILLQNIICSFLRDFFLGYWFSARLDWNWKSSSSIVFVLTPIRHSWGIFAPYFAWMFFSGLVPHDWDWLGLTRYLDPWHNCRARILFDPFSSCPKTANHTKYQRSDSFIFASCSWDIHHLCPRPQGRQHYYVSHHQQYQWRLASYNIA